MLRTLRLGSLAICFSPGMGAIATAAHAAAASAKSDYLVPARVLDAH